MDNFDLKKYLAESKLLKENRYDLDDPNSPLYILNNNDQDVAILNNMTKKYGKDVVLMWLSSGEYGDRLYENNLTENKGLDLAKDVVSKAREAMKKLTDEEVEAFRKEIANAFDLK